MPKIKPFQEFTDEYDRWFDDNRFAYLSELEAVKKALPHTNEVIEVGIGSGIFAEPLGIKEGIDPSEAMLQKARQKKLNVQNAVAEKLPYADASRNGMVMITAICFVDNIYQAFHEAHRVLRDKGFLILGFVDKDSPIGKEYLEHKDESIFYRDATFFGTEELYNILKESGFSVVETFQTVFGNLENITEVQPVMEGFGKGSFVVIKALKEL
ncbi:MAG TPA: SAM-dependent methyltransferase [Bacteroidales bacterium]|nr:SAM-dependent methyltransferase [Bacteroidales bacterium]